MRFELDSSLPTSKQLAQVTQAIADGALTVDEAKDLVDMIRLQAEARKFEGSSEEAQRLVEAFKEISKHVHV